MKADAPLIDSIETIVRPAGYAIPGHTHIRAAGSVGALRVEGFGSGEVTIARIKAVSELVERATMLATGGGVFQTLSSNGWAAHSNSELAVSAAAFELIERETALETWFNFGPYFEVPKHMWPSEVLSWEAQASSLEFSRISVVLSLGSNGACVSTLLYGRDHACIAGHASGDDLESAILSAFSEALRGAHASLRLESFGEVQRLHSARAAGTFGPGANALAYAYGARLPKLNFVDLSEMEIRKIWLQHLRRAANLIRRVEVATYAVGDRIVASVFDKDVMQIFWGPTPLNMKVQNGVPHFVG